jgi:hypothetical protein
VDSLWTWPRLVFPPARVLVCLGGRGSRPSIVHCPFPPRLDHAISQRPARTQPCSHAVQSSHPDQQTASCRLRLAHHHFSHSSLYKYTRSPDYASPCQCRVKTGIQNYSSQVISCSFRIPAAISPSIKPCNSLPVGLCRYQVNTRDRFALLQLLQLLQLLLCPSS